MAPVVAYEQLPARAAFFNGPESAELEADERRFLEHDTRMLLITDNVVIPVSGR